jgi:energy-coupling factor transporter ATPase
MIKIRELIHDYIKRDEEGNPAGTVRAIDDVSLDVKPGQFIAILGHNGSGKSTLAKHLNALLHPTEGTVWVNGMDTKDVQRVLDIRQTAGMVFQNPDNQIIGQVVEEDVGFGPENMGVPTEEIWERVESALNSVGMYAYRESNPSRLSGGQKQRIAIARVFLKNPPILILDEATSALDNESERYIQESLEKLSVGRTTITIAHRLSTILGADEIIVLDGDGIKERGKHKELIKQGGLYEKYYRMQLGAV